jgi:small subunit ribosomal protein S17
MAKTNKEKSKKRLEGTIVSNKMQDTVVVSVGRKMPHPKYGKIISKRKRYYARSTEKHQIGEVVTIEESRPLSKTIRWIVIEKK